MFTSAVIARKRVPAANWSAVWYLLSSYAVISYTENAFYVAFAAMGSWVGAYASLTFLHRPPGARRSELRRSEAVKRVSAGLPIPSSFEASAALRQLRVTVRQLSAEAASMKIPRRRQDAHVAGVADFLRRHICVVATVVVERLDQVGACRHRMLAA